MSANGVLRKLVGDQETGPDDEDPDSSTSENGVSDTSEESASDGDLDGAMEVLSGQTSKLLDSVVDAIPSVILALLVLLLVWLISRGVKSLVSRLLKAAKVRRSLINLSRTVISVMFWVLGLLIAMSVVFPSVKVSSVLAALGVGGIAVGFAFKDMFENFIAGVMIMLRKSMKIGDFIECDGVEGEVKRIQIRDTYIRQLDNQLVLMPNAMLYKNPVYVRTEQDLRRYEIIAGVSYDSDVDAAREVIREAVEQINEVSDQHPVEVFAREFNASSIDFTVRWWANSRQLGMHESRDKVISRVKAALNEAGIEIPFPHRTLTFKNDDWLEPIRREEQQPDEFHRGTKDNAGLPKCHDDNRPSRSNTYEKDAGQ